MPSEFTQPSEIPCTMRLVEAIRKPIKVVGALAHLHCVESCVFLWHRHFIKSACANLVSWLLPEDYCKKGPCNFNMEMFVSKVGNPYPTLGQHLASRILYALLVAERQHEIATARFCTQSCSQVGQLLVNSSPTPHPTRSCKGLPCNSPLATPDSESSKPVQMRTYLHKTPQKTKTNMHKFASPHPLL